MNIVKLQFDIDNKLLSMYAYNFNKHRQMQSKECPVGRGRVCRKYRHRVGTRLHPHPAPSVRSVPQLWEFSAGRQNWRRAQSAKFSNITLYKSQPENFATYPALPGRQVKVLVGGHRDRAGRRGEVEPSRPAHPHRADRQHQAQCCRHQPLLPGRRLYCEVVPGSGLYAGGVERGAEVCCLRRQPAALPQPHAGPVHPQHQLPRPAPHLTAYTATDF